MLRAAVLAGSLVAALVAAPAAAGAAPTTTPAPTAASPDRLGIQLLDAPVSLRGDPRALTYIIDQLPPGTTIERHVRITNFADGPADISMYAAGATIDSGVFRFADARTGNDLTSWTSISPPTSQVPAFGSADVTVTIAVPAQAGGGEQYAVIWAEEASAPAPGAAQEINRVGIRAYLSVSGDPQTSSFDITSITATRDADGRPRVTAALRNTGDRAVDVAGTVSLSDGPADLRAGPVDTDATTTLAPGDTGSVSAPFDPALPAGPWLASIALVSGTTEAQASATVTFPVADGPPDVTAIDHGGRTWWIVGAILVVALVLLLWVALRRRDRETEEAIPL